MYKIWKIKRDKRDINLEILNENLALQMVRCLNKEYPKSLIQLTEKSYDKAPSVYQIY